MRKLLSVLLIAGVLVAALSVPALATASDPPNAYGQAWKYLNSINPDPPGETISWLAQATRGVPIFWPEWVQNYGDFVWWVKMNPPEVPE